MGIIERAVYIVGGIAKNAQKMLTDAQASAQAAAERLVEEARERRRAMEALRRARAALHVLRHGEYRPAPPEQMDLMAPHNPDDD